MLILTRKPGDAVLIDGGIRIVVLASDSGGVRLGFEAPSSVSIVRAEAAQRVPGEQAAPGGSEAPEASLGEIERADLT